MSRMKKTILGALLILPLVTGAAIAGSSAEAATAVIVIKTDSVPVHAPGRDYRIALANAERAHHPLPPPPPVRHHHHPVR